MLIWMYFSWNYHFLKGWYYLIIKFANARINIYETDCNVYDRVKICKYFPGRAQTLFSQLRKSSELVICFVVITKCLLIEKEGLILKPLVIFCNFLKNADISILIFFNVLVGNNHVNLCTKYNVYIMFLT